MRVLRLCVWELIGLSVGVMFVGVLMRGMCPVVEHEAQHLTDRRGACDSDVGG